MLYKSTRLGLTVGTTSIVKKNRKKGKANERPS